MKKLNKTMEINLDEMAKTVPVVCSKCAKVFSLKKKMAKKGEKATADTGVCPECEAEEKKGSGKNASSAPSERFGTMVFNVDDMPKTIPVACSWCGKVYHLKHWQIEKGRRSGISHGICPECEKKQLEELKKGKND
jgi:ssDNA-binding Zn-finger/Zn-ribbon topoisomerase 1